MQSEMRKSLNLILKQFSELDYVHPEDIPNIDLYVDQVTTFIESASGVEEGGRTGLTAFTAAVLFLACMFIAPIAALIPAPATSAALIYVGVLMLGGLRNLDFDDVSQVLPVSLMLIFMPISGSIGHGIGIALISYTAVKLLTGRAKDISVLTYVLSLLFILKFFLIV